LISAFSLEASGCGWGNPGLGSFAAGGANGNISDAGAEDLETGASIEAFSPAGVLDAWGAACSAGSLTETMAGVSLANGWVYSRRGVITSTDVGL